MGGHYESFTLHTCLLDRTRPLITNEHSLENPAECKVTMPKVTEEHGGRNNPKVTAEHPGSWDESTINPSNPLP
jgi:hypothetical protein